MGCASSEPIDIYYIYGIEKPKSEEKEVEPPKYKNSMQYIADENQPKKEKGKSENEKKEKKDVDESKDKKSKKKEEEKEGKEEKEGVKKKPAGKKSGGGSKGGSSKPKDEKEEKEEHVAPVKNKKPLYEMTNDGKHPNALPLLATAPPNIGGVNNGDHQNAHNGHPAHSHKNGKSKSAHQEKFDTFNGQDTSHSNTQMGLINKPKIKKSKRNPDDSKEQREISLVNNDIQANQNIQGYPPPVYTSGSQSKKKDKHKEDGIHADTALYPNLLSESEQMQDDHSNIVGANTLGLIAYHLHQNSHKYDSEDDEEESDETSSSDDSDEPDEDSTTESGEDEDEEEDGSDEVEGGSGTHVVILNNSTGSGDDSDDERSSNENDDRPNEIREFDQSDDNDLLSDSDRSQSFENRGTILVTNDENEMKNNESENEEEHVEIYTLDINDDEIEDDEHSLDENDRKEDQINEARDYASETNDVEEIPIVDNNDDQIEDDEHSLDENDRNEDQINEARDNVSETNDMEEIPIVDNNDDQTSLHEGENDFQTNDAEEIDQELEENLSEDTSSNEECEECDRNELNNNLMDLNANNDYPRETSPEGRIQSQK